MAVVCQACTSPLSDVARFCGHCGAPIQSTGVPQSRVTTGPRGEAQQTPPDPQPAPLPHVPAKQVGDGIDISVTAVDRSATQGAWWTAAVCGALILLTSVMPWWRSGVTTLLGGSASSGESHIGLAAGPTAWCGIALAFAAGVIALAQVQPTVRLPRTPTRPAVIATWLAAGAVLCIVVRSASLSRDSSSVFGITTMESNLAGGAVLANVAAIAQLGALIVVARQSAESITPDLSLSLDVPDPAASSSSSGVTDPARPREITAAAVLCFVIAGLSAVVALSAIAMGIGVGSIPLLDQLGAVIVLVGLIPAALCVWLAVLGLRLLRRTRWSRTGCLITTGVLGGLSAISALTSSTDPTAALLAAGSCAAAFVLLCTAPARRAVWT